MVLRDKTRATDSNCPAMASDQPLKKKQRTQPPDPSDEGVVSLRSEEHGSPHSEDAVDCVAVASRDSTENLQRFAGGMVCLESSSEAMNGIRNPHFPFSVHTLGVMSAYNPSIDCETKKDEGDSVFFQHLDLFQEQLIKQCLCNLNEETLNTPFSCRLNIVNWPPNKILLFLSNLQLLFDVYLKQNYKGSICIKLKDVCDKLVRNEHDWIGEVIDLADHQNKFVNFIACRVVSSFLIVAKDNIDLEWLKRIMENIHSFDTFNYINISKINFSLDIIKRVVEWKDIDQHPLEDSAYINTSNPLRQDQSEEPCTSRNEPSCISRISTSIHSVSSESSLQNAFSHLHTSSSDSNFMVHSTCEQSVHHPNDFSNISQSLQNVNSFNNGFSSISSQFTSHINTVRQCNIITLTDSESFDTSHVKCLTIRCLEKQWSHLIENIKQLLTNYLNISNSENCILSFLSLWESIISVKANLSVIDTKLFYMDFQSFVNLLRFTNLPSLIYVQLLSLFNEVLCYGSTLALQDTLPEETCALAHTIVRFVKDLPLLNNISIRHSQTGFNFIGFESSMMTSYSLDSHNGENSAQSTSQGIQNNETNVLMHSREPASSHRNFSLSRNESDKTMLQKMVLLVLKSVAVTVKEMRCDSSDSSIDSTDYNAIQDMQMVERSIRDVLKKLDAFLKRTLNFLPDSAFTKILIHLFSDQDDYLIESMVCTLDITVGIVYRNSAFPDLIPMLNPAATFIEFLEVVSHDSDILLDYLVSNETCFLLYLLRFLKYVRKNWSKFVETCHDVGVGGRGLDNTMSVLIRLRHQISRLVASSLFPYNINPVLRLLEVCENMYEGSELS